ncbi:hypothetical protein AGMMS50229_03140 [Campylobacterota bacterium]|nr:hypothetical protein AGMMS50229_03140 [Campylobacterota bacterium]
MSIKTPTLALIYESQGLKAEAAEIYREILAQNPANTDARLALARLGGKRRSFAGANREMVDFFVRMDSRVEIAEFERYLIFA